MRTKIYCIIGRHGFIGSALSNKLQSMGYEVTSNPSSDVDAIFDFGSPVHLPFEDTPDYFINTILPRHLYFLSSGKYYVWPSSALVSEDREIAFTHYKKALEELSLIYPNNLGLRIFPVYGPGEKRTAIYQWCYDMKKGKRPIIWGDGKQKRDFIHIDDVIESIINLSAIGQSESKRNKGIMDLGGGKPVSFNKVVNTINRILDSNLKPIYKSAPKGYSRGIVCKNPVPTRVSLEKGCRSVLDWIDAAQTKNH
jgi:nucleoside-diphosphate-sugar epimerase